MAGRATSDVGDLIAAAYEGGFDPSRWSAFLARFESLVAGHGTGLFIIDRRSTAAAYMTTTLSPAVERTYREHYHSRNPWLGDQGRLFLLANEAGVGESVLSPSELKRTEFYHDWLRPQGILHCMGAVVSQSASLFVLLTSLREAARGPFTQREVRLLARLRPHLLRAVEAQRRSAADLQARDASVAALDRLPYGWIVADAAGRAMHINVAARRMTDRGDVDLRNTALSGLIARVAKCGLGEDLACPRRTGRPLWISALPLRAPQSKPFSSGTLVGIVISDPDQASLTDPERIRRFWKLTRAEADLAAELVRGLDVAAAAQRLGITRTTARNQLRSILSKTGTHRQSELVRLILTAPPQFHLD